ncbi:DNA translocase FtsK 4TM domain-containing protein [Algiphilus sp.]|uniref:DNA translocase FtsK n=2 Tax=Algiphilus sp. TaxID=1872431 RepID=UPI0032EF93B5
MPKASVSRAATHARRLERLTREVVLLLLFGMALSLLLALFSFHPGDPGWSSTGSGDPVRNLFGPVGAWVADVLLSLFGYVALAGSAAVLLLLLQSWRRGRYAPDDAPNEERSAAQQAEEETASFVPGPLMRTAAGAVSAASASALSALHIAANPSLVPQGAGGIIGSELAILLRELLNPVGASLLLLIVLAVALPILGLFSWLGVFERVGAAIVGTTQRLSQAYHRRREARAAQAAQSSAPVAAPVPRAAPTVDAGNGPALEKGSKSRRARRKAAKAEKVQAAEPREEQLSLAIDDKSAGAVPAFTGDPLPPLEMLDPPRPSNKGYTQDDVERISRDLERHLKDFNVEATVVEAQPGPVVTRFELQPAPGVKGSQITNLSRDLARALSVSSVRVIEVIAGKSVVGLEIPNQHRDIVSLSAILNSPEYRNMASPLTMGLGKDIAGRPVVVDLGKMPHLMVAGTTGSGKSVAINTMILSMLYKATHKQLRFIFIDPKMLELSVYEGIPHLLTPVVTDMKDAANALRWCVGEMERRYQLMTRVGVRNLAGLNKKVREAIERGEPMEDPLQSAPLFADGEEDPDAPPKPRLEEEIPHIVVVIDELADMMMVVGKKVEELIARIAQKARAAGIHLIVATQRPSVDVITGLIKANIPTRLAFQVASRVDSRTILDEIGAETLLGHGDSLFRPVGSSRIDRVHGAFVDDHEVHKVAEYLKQVAEPEYIDAVCAGDAEAAAGGGEGGDAEQDPLYDQAVQIVIESGKASTSWVQRRLKIGYNRAARIVEQMEASGVVGPSGPGGNRDILVPTNNE